MPILFPMIVPVLGVVAAVIILFVVISFLNKKKAYTNLYNKLLTYSDKVEVVNGNPAFDFKMTYNDKLFLIKLIYNPSCYEININAKHYWQRNEGVVSSRKKGEQMKGVYDLTFFDLKANNYPLDTVKLYVIYPDSTRLMKVINECEMVMIDPSVDIYGTRVERYKKLDENINKF